MAVLAPILPYLAAGAAVVGTAVSIDQQRQAGNAQKDARRAQENAKAEQQAQQNAEAAQSRRQQVREARIKRAQILQASENTGTAGSSGEIGAGGGIGTQLSSNMGFSQGNIERSQRIGGFMQESANFMGDAQQHANNAQMASQLGSFTSNIFSTMNENNIKQQKKIQQGNL